MSGQPSKAPGTASADAPRSNAAQVVLGQPPQGPNTSSTDAQRADTPDAANKPAQGTVTPSAQPTPATQGSRDHRKSPRRRVLKEGKVIFGKAQSVVDVTIDNMSEGGAHIRMLSSHGLPGEFYLAEASRGIIHRAEVAWRTATGMGLRLLGPLEDVSAREAFLRKFRRN